MMAGAYTLSKNGHVRGDVLYGFFEPRTQATIDLILYFLFFIPGVFALTYAGYFYAAESWAINEHSNITADGPPIYPFKTVIPIAGALPAAAGHRRDHPLHHLPPRRRVAVARGGRRGGRRRQAEGDGARRRGHGERSRVRRGPGGGAMKIRKELWFGFGLMARDPRHDRRLHAVGQPDQRSPRPADARADRRRDHAGLPDRVHADGHGRVLRLAVLPQRQPGPRGAPGARPDGAARLLGDVERRADRRSRCSCSWAIWSSARR